jgi:hypothetical protein
VSVAELSRPLPFRPPHSPVRRPRPACRGPLPAAVAPGTPPPGPTAPRRHHPPLTAAGPVAPRAQRVDALTDQLLARLARAGPAERLQLERLDKAALDRLALELLTRLPPAGPAQPQGQ